MVPTPDLSHELVFCIVGGISTIFPPEGRGGTPCPTHSLQDQPRSRASIPQLPVTSLMPPHSTDQSRGALICSKPSTKWVARLESVFPAPGLTSVGAFWVPGKKTRHSCGISAASPHILSASGQCSLLCLVSGDTNADRAGGVHDTTRVLRRQGRRAHRACHAQRGSAVSCLSRIAPLCEINSLHK